ncbi:hypothetical protein LguiB_033059 [Lonicera macranthoides]
MEWTTDVMSFYGVKWAHFRKEERTRGGRLEAMEYLPSSFVFAIDVYLNICLIAFYLFM